MRKDREAIRRFRRTVRENETIIVGAVSITVRRVAGKGNRILLCVDSSGTQEERKR